MERSGRIYRKNWKRVLMVVSASWREKLTVELIEVRCVRVCVHAVPSVIPPADSGVLNQLMIE
jgi:hypothetical protein